MILRRSFTTTLLLLACVHLATLLSKSHANGVVVDRPLPPKRSSTVIVKQVFGKLSGGETVDIYTLRNRNGMEARITNYGATLVSLTSRDRRGRTADVVLGYDDPRSYETDEFYIGSVQGRYANRIAGGKFTLDGKEFTLARNNGGNHLHGGVRGFNKRIWKATEVKSASGAALQLIYVSPDGEEGYPGKLTTSVTYSLSDHGELKIFYQATADRATVLNLTNHAYFNLKGAGAGDILDHELYLNAARFTPTDQTAIPTGELRDVKGTPLDFTIPQRIGARIEADDEQIRFGAGYDHNFVLNPKHLSTSPGRSRGAVAEVYEPTSGRIMRMFTTEPGVQFYTGNFLKDVRGKAGKIYGRRGGFCLEAQHFPDSPNKPAFPSVVLRPGAAYTQTTIYQFSAR